jgi:excisionase family DNA binding protein
MQSASSHALNDGPAPERVQHSFEPLLTSEEAAALLSIHPKTLQKFARSGKIPAVRIGDLWRFRASALDEWVRGAVSSSCHSCRN